MASSSLPQELTQTETSLATLEQLLARAKEVNVSSQAAYQQLTDELKRLQQQETDLKQQLVQQKSEETRLTAEVQTSRGLLSNENLNRITNINATLERVNALLRQG